MASPFRVISVASNKGGVGKTTLATNLAVYLRALREELPVLIVGLDDQNLIDRMFALDRGDQGKNALDVLRDGDLSPALRLGQYGVHYVPTSPAVTELRRDPGDPFPLRETLEKSGWRGLVILDTPGDLGVLTRSALAASDLALLVVADRSSLDQVRRIYELFAEWGRPAERARVVLSMLDLRIKYRETPEGDILALLISEIRRRGHPLFESFISRSPKVESLVTNPQGLARSILHGARGTLIDRQMAHLADDVLRAVGAGGELAAEASPRDRERRREPRRAFLHRLAAFGFADPPVMALSTLDLSAAGMGVRGVPGLGVGERIHVAMSAPEADETFLVWARVARDDGHGRLGLRFEADPDERRRLAGFLAALPAGTP